MTTKRKKNQVSHEHVAELIEEIAKRVETQNYDFDIQVAISTVGQALVELRHADGLRLINRIGHLLTAQNSKTAPNRYGDYVQKRLAEIPPLDPIADSAALRALAAEIAANTSQHSTNTGAA
jgi:hypothetical protein